MRIEAWTLWQKKLIGRVYGHPKFEDGQMIVTATLRHLDFNDGVALTESGQVYDLKEPQATAEELCSEVTYAV